jgi:DNA polymerase-1
MNYHHTVVDFETDKIEDRPNYPPNPVGVAIYPRTGGKEYLAWGHPEENNTTKIQATRRLKSVWDQPLLFHNAAFDIEVAVEHLGLKVPLYWDDSLILGYLHDPRDVNLSLKPMANKYLKMPPKEQDRLKEWILVNIPAAKRKPSSWGAYIAQAPGKLVGKYAIGDVVRTKGLFNYFMPIIRDTGMERAYQREKRIISVKLDMERQGIRIAPKLKKEYGSWVKARANIDENIRKRLRVGKDFNINSPKQLADILVKRNKLTHIVKTPKGNISTKREVLEENCNDQHLLQLLSLNGVFGTYLGTFIDPWVLSFENNEGLIYPTFNTVRSSNEYGSGGIGTRTGRFSSSNPNFQNIPANTEDSQHKELLLALQKHLKRYGINFIGLRDYIIPKAGCVFIGRDYSQQELRILGHYEDGELLTQYNTNPRLDVHEFIRQLIFQATRILYERRHVKITVFGIIYGMGIKKLAKRLGLSYDEASNLRKAIYDAVPGIKWLNTELKKLGKAKEPIYTWGGRRYFAEKDKWIVDEFGEERRKQFFYKLLNLLIQGSAADATKEGMIQVSESCNANVFAMLVQAHDEVLAEVEKGHEKTQMNLMKEAMEDLKFEIPMLTDGKIGAQSWARMRSYKDA